MDGLISALVAERQRLGRALDALGLLQTAVEAVSVLGHRISVSSDGSALHLRVEIVGMPLEADLVVVESDSAPAPAPAPATAKPVTPPEAENSEVIDLIARGPWAREEVDLAWEMAQNGATNAEIGRAIGRRPLGVGPALYAERRRRGKPAPTEPALSRSRSVGSTDAGRVRLRGGLSRW